MLVRARERWRHAGRGDGGGDVTPLEQVPTDAAEWRRRPRAVRPRGERAEYVVTARGKPQQKRGALPVAPAHKHHPVVAARFRFGESEATGELDGGCDAQVDDQFALATDDVVADGVGDQPEGGSERGGAEPVGERREATDGQGDDAGAHEPIGTCAVEDVGVQRRIDEYRQVERPHSG